ncbi:hypothetical protein [Bacteroides caecimuris]|uniref:hypothetical protein n=1 Tax=Bacteroides caecimuris TaxID=1796613 RepID=UPI0026E526B5|nr:hypothetical protein [Bacteroides caecimuris]
MNEIIKITAKALPNAQLPQLPLPIPPLDEEPIKAYPPEFWLSIHTKQQQALIKEFEDNGLEYLIYEIVDSVPAISKAVCRSWRSYIETEAIVEEICHKMRVDGFVVSDGCLASINANGDFKGFIYVD